MAKKQSLYVGIEDSVSVRKDLLMSSKALLQSLKQYQKVHDVRAKKLETMYQYRRVLEEIAVLSKRLVKVMPNTPSPKKTVVKRAEKKPVVVKAKKQDLETVKQLESELAGIEKKLSSLGKL